MKAIDRVNPKSSHHKENTFFLFLENPYNLSFKETKISASWHYSVLDFEDYTPVVFDMLLLPMSP